MWAAEKTTKPWFRVSLVGLSFTLAKNTIAMPLDTAYGMFPGIILNTS